MVVLQPSILITDDDRQFRETLRGVLAPQGFRTLVAGDGEEAIEIVRNDEVHVLLLDMHMPKLTGIETLREVKRIRGLLPCILLSAEMDEAMRDRALSAHAFSVLAKPVRRREITEAIEQAMQSVYGWRRDPLR